MAVNLCISTEEARALLMCLGFVRRNIVFSDEKKRFQFVSGKPLDMSIREAIGIDFLKDYIENETESAINSHPLNSFVSFF